MAPKTKAAEPLASSQQEDVSMMDASEAGSEPVTGGKEKGDPHNPSTAIQNEQRISVVSVWTLREQIWRWDSYWHVTKLSGSTATAASYQFQDEDHTLGNALRYIIMKKYACPSIISFHTSIVLQALYT